MIRLLLLLALVAPAAAPWPTLTLTAQPSGAPGVTRLTRILDLCGFIPDNGAPWWSEDGFGNPRPCPGDTPPTPTPTPEPALRYRVVLAPVWR